MNTNECIELLQERLKTSKEKRDTGIQEEIEGVKTEKIDRDLKGRFRTKRIYYLDDGEVHLYWRMVDRDRPFVLRNDGVHYQIERRRSGENETETIMEERWIENGPYPE